MHSGHVRIGGYRLLHAEILYRFPDYPSLLQTYIWQEYDLPPSYPRLKAFLDFWQRELDGRLFAVRIGRCHEDAGSRMPIISDALIRLD